MHTYTYTYTHAHIHIYMFAHIHTYTYIHTHTKCIYARTQARLKRRRGRLRGKPDLTPRSSALLPVRCNLEGDYSSWPAAQLPVHEEQRISAEQPQPTAAHHTITTARRPDHIRLSALVPCRSAQFMAHPSCQLGRGSPKRGHFPAILASFFRFYYHLEFASIS